MVVLRHILRLGPNTCHVSDILDHQDIGWAVEHDDIERAEQIIRELHATTYESRTEKGRNAWQIVDQKFSKQNLCGRFCDVIQHGPGEGRAK